MTNGLRLTFENSALVATHADGSPWFRFRDVLDAIDYGETKSLSDRYNAGQFARVAPDAVYQSAWSILPDEDKKQIREDYAEGPPRVVQYVSEDGVYQLAMASRSEKSKRFRKWVAGVCRSIREYGVYPPPGSDRAPMTTARGLLAAVQQLVEHDERISVLEAAKADEERFRQEVLDRIAMTVAAPGFFSARQYLLLRNLDPEKPVRNVAAKKAVGSVASRLCRERRIQMGTIVEGTFKVNTYPANILDESISMLGLVH